MIGENKEWRELLINKYGMTKQQAYSKVLDIFIFACANEEGLLKECELEAYEKFKKEAEEEERRADSMRATVWKLEQQLQSLPSEIDAAAIRDLSKERDELEKQVAELRKLKETESIDDAKIRNYLNMITWMQENFSEQEIISFCNMGKGFFGGWIDPPAQFRKAAETNNRELVEIHPERRRRRV